MQSDRSFRPRALCASDIASNSACRVTSASRTTRLIASATTSPSRHMTHENGSSCCLTAAADNSMHRLIIFKSISARFMASAPAKGDETWREAPQTHLFCRVRCGSPSKTRQQFNTTNTMLTEKSLRAPSSTHQRCSGFDRNCRLQSGSPTGIQMQNLTQDSSTVRGFPISAG